MNVKNFFSYTTLILLISLLAFSACNSGQSASIANLAEKDQTLLNDKRKKYKILSVGQFKVHYPADSYSASQKALLKEELDYALSRTLDILEVPSFEEEAHFILFPTKAAMDAHLGQVPIRHYVNADYNTGYFVHNEDLRPYFTQTLFQMVAIENWGRPKGIMLAIGGSIFADTRCQDVKYFLDEIGAALYRSGNMMSYRAMFADYYPALKAKPALAEIQAAALFQFVKDNFGIKKVKELWMFGLNRLEGVIYLSPGEVEKEIITRWQNYTPTQEVDLDKLLQYGC